MTSTYEELRCARRYYFEYPIEGGRIDLLYEREDGWVIVDFKTGDPTQPHREYDAQLHRYEEALRGRGMRIATTRLCWL